MTDYYLLLLTVQYFGSNFVQLHWTIRCKSPETHVLPSCLWPSTSINEASGWNIAYIRRSFVYHLFNVLKNLNTVALEEECKLRWFTLWNSLHPLAFLFHGTSCSSFIWKELPSSTQVSVQITITTCEYKKLDQNLRSQTYIPCHYIYKKGTHDFIKQTTRD